MGDLGDYQPAMCDPQATNGDDSKLLATALLRFDKLRQDGTLFYGEPDSEPEIVVENRFAFQISLIKAFTQKPWPGKSSPVAKPDPFGQPEPSFVVSSTATHLLQFNKFNALRPQFVLHPRQYASQQDLVTSADFEAALWFRGLLDRGDDADDSGKGPEKRMGSNHGMDRWIVFYNCCPESGSSQPYKHLQIVPEPNQSNFTLWPDRDDITAYLSTVKPGVPTLPPASSNIPYLCSLTKLSPALIASSTSVHDAYVSALSYLEVKMGEKVTAHNMLMTREWLCIVPRREAGSPCAANSLGMMGVLWMSSEEEMVGWHERGYTTHLRSLGYSASS